MQNNNHEKTLNTSEPEESTDSIIGRSDEAAPVYPVSPQPQNYSDKPHPPKNEGANGSGINDNQSPGAVPPPVYSAAPPPPPTPYYQNIPPVSPPYGQPAYRTPQVGQHIIVPPRPQQWQPPQPQQAVQPPTAPPMVAPQSQQWQPPRPQQAVQPPTAPPMGAPQSQQWQPPRPQQAVQPPTSPPMGAPQSQQWQPPRPQQAVHPPTAPPMVAPQSQQWQPPRPQQAVQPPTAPPMGAPQSQQWQPPRPQQAVQPPTAPPMGAPQSQQWQPPRPQQAVHPPTAPPMVAPQYPYPPTGQYNPQYGMPPGGIQRPPNTPTYQPPIAPKRKFDFEKQLGGKITNIIGISLILLAVIFGLHYTYTVVQSNLIKGIIAYSLGIIFIMLSELSARKSGPNFFSIGLCAGGVAVLFATTGLCYFSLGLFTPIGACIASAIVFAISMFLSLRNNSQLIGVFSVIGGYLPIIAFAPSFVVATAAMIYFTLINLFVLILARVKNWNIIKFFCLALNIICTSILINQVPDSTLIILSGYVILNFLLFFAMTTVHPLVERKTLNPVEILLIIINTVASFTFLSLVIEQFMKSPPYWVVSLIFAVFYLAFSVIWAVYVKKDIAGHVLFLATGLVFLVMATVSGIVEDYMFLAVALEGFVLALIALIKRQKLHFRIGSILALVGSSLFFLSIAQPLFAIGVFVNSRANISIADIVSYFLITLASIALLGALKFASNEPIGFWSRRQSSILSAYKSMTVVNILVFLLFVATFILAQLPINLNRAWYIFAAGAIVPLFIIVTQKLKDHKSVGDNVFLVIQLFYSAIALLIVDNRRSLSTSLSGTLHIVLFVLGLFAINALGVFALHQVLVRVGKNSQSMRKAHPLIISLVSLFLVIVSSNTHILSGNQSVVVSLIILLWALGMLVFGFINDDRVMRLTGLGLSGVAIFKIFFIDITSLTGSYRVLSFAISGLLFLGMSYAYKFFTDRLLDDENKAAKAQSLTTVVENLPADMTGDHGTIVAPLPADSDDTVQPSSTFTDAVETSSTLTEQAPKAIISDAPADNDEDSGSEEEL